jgi:hypothetical protein
MLPGHRLTSNKVFFVHLLCEQSPTLSLPPAVLGAGKQKEIFDGVVRRYVRNLEVFLGLRNAPFGVDVKNIAGGLVTFFVRYVRH